MRAIEILGRGASFYNYWQSGTEIWACNVLHFVFTGDDHTPAFDRAFWMDDLFYLEQNKPGTTAELQKDGRQYYTSVAYPDKLPNGIEFPLKRVIRDLAANNINIIRRGPKKLPYLNNTIPYMIMMAISELPDEIHVHGVDYLARGEQDINERACVEHWLGIAVGAGIKVKINAASALMDTSQFFVKDFKNIYGGHEGIYGYTDPPDLSGV